MTKTNLCIISGFHCSVNEILHGPEHETSRMSQNTGNKLSFNTVYNPRSAQIQKQIQCSKHCDHLEDCIQGNLKSTAATSSSPKCKLLPDYMASHSQQTQQSCHHSNFQLKHNAFCSEHETTKIRNP